MNEKETLREAYRGKMHRNRISLFFEILITCSIALAVIANSNISFRQQAHKYTTDVEGEYNSLMTSYTRQFDVVYAQIVDKIQQDLSFEEMDAWLKSMDPVWAEAMGSSDIFDGISFTYKDDFARSWSYGDYSEYDPTTRDWYKLAKKAGGKTAIVAPYVTFLDSQESNDGSYLVMSIVKQYNEDIYVDYDIKLVEMEKMLDGKIGTYEKERLFIFDEDGYILSCNEHKKFSHNINEADEQLSDSFCKAMKKAKTHSGKLSVAIIDQVPTFVYLKQGNEGHYDCLMVPFWEVAKHDYLLVLIIVFVLIILEGVLYRHNQRSEREFMNRDERLSALTSASFTGHIYVNLENFIFSGNRLAHTMCPSDTYEELFALFLSLLSEKEEVPAFEEFLSKEVLRRSFNLEYNLETRRFSVKRNTGEYAGTVRTMEISRLAFLEDGKETYSIAYRDVTEDAEVLKDALEQAENASKAKGFFLSNMSHEIRTPLNAVIGYLSIAKDSKEDLDKVWHCLDNCEIASKHLLQIINDVLDMSSIETGKLKIAHEDFDLKKQIGDITAIFYQNSKGKQITFETHVENLEEEWVKGDSLRLNQVLMNLLSNAVKFTKEQGKITFSVRQISCEAQKVYIQFAVADNGIGMSEEYMARLFRPFEQENASTARKYGGSGLGLSITHNLVEMMNGTIKVESKQGEGTTFTLTMPFDKSEDHPVVAISPINYSHVRALVVDDQQDEGTYVKVMLKRCGVKSDTVTSGADAIKRLKSRRGSEYAYNLCIMDWHMPEMDGIQVAAKIREEMDEDIPIIIATAYDTSEIEEDAKRSGVNLVVSKPLFQSTLFDLLVSAFGKYTPHSDADVKDKLTISGVRVLLAEDNAMNMDIAVTVLAKAGVLVDQAVNGQEAYQKFVDSAEGTYQLILMDVQMPVLDGYAATEKIRESAHPEAQTIPIIAMTANAFAEDVAEALSHGMNAHISKPINYDKLFEVVREFSE